MDLPFAIRFRYLKEHAKEAVGAYRSVVVVLAMSDYVVSKFVVADFYTT